MTCCRRESSIYILHQGQKAKQKGLLYPNYNKRHEEGIVKFPIFISLFFPTFLATVHFLHFKMSGTKQIYACPFVFCIVGI